MQIFLGIADEEHVETQALIQRTKNRLKRLMKAAKRKWINNELEKATPDDIWCSQSGLKVSTNTLPPHQSWPRPTHSSFA